MRVAVRVKTRHPVTRVGGSHAGALVVRVSAAPVGGQANAAVVRAVAEAFSVAPSRVRLVSGPRSASKVLEVTGDPAELRRRLDALLATP